MTLSLRIQIAAAAVVCLLLGRQPVQATYIYIDTFTSPTQSLTIAGGGTSPTNLFDHADSGVALGGEREVLLNRTNGTGQTTTRVANSLTNGITFGLGVGTLGSVVAIYDGDDNSLNTNFAGLASFDLTDAGANDTFWLRGGAEVVGGQFVVTVYSSSNDFSQMTLSVPGGTFLGDDTLFTNFFFSFALMTDFGLGADFTDVNAITLELSGLASPGVDMGLNVFAVIPEPGAWWAIAGLAGIAFLRRRLRRSRD